MNHCCYLLSLSKPLLLPVFNIVGLLIMIHLNVNTCIYCWKASLKIESTAWPSQWLSLFFNILISTHTFFMLNSSLYFLSLICGIQIMNYCCSCQSYSKPFCTPNCIEYSPGSKLTESIACSSPWLLWVSKELIHIPSFCLVVIFIAYPAYICGSWIMIYYTINYWVL